MNANALSIAPVIVRRPPAAGMTLGNDRGLDRFRALGDFSEERFSRVRFLNLDMPQPALRRHGVDVHRKAIKRPN